ncbi:hypothetical protein DYB32_002382 [Aphanomyces invadans]|uniref:Polycystin domain-containing protein n=1 Tax=Aphanomyces invadans TaxID=157072 RepID=A0A3R6WQJ2_9STRA|nr:hypothetical protein DYB32_002382 [Aphanomyces invadans]
MLAKSMTQCNELNDDMIHRVEHLSGLQQEALGTIVHNESLLQVTRQVLDMDKPWPARVSSVSKTFRESVESIEELHKYLCEFEPVHVDPRVGRLDGGLVGSFYDVVYSGGSFDGDNAFPPGNAYSPRGVLGGYGEIWGPIRIGQVRVDGVPCSGMLIETSPHLKNESTLCYPEYTASTASQASFGHHGATYSYDSVPPSVEPSITSTVCRRARFTAVVARFFDRATRAVFIDMAVYNRNFRDVSVVRLYIEAYPAGGMEPRGLIQTERLYAYSSSHDAVKIIGEIAVLIAATHQLYRIEMFGLMLIFLVSLVGSAMAFNMVSLRTNSIVVSLTTGRLQAFGMRLHNYHTLTLVQVIINKVELEALVETNQVLGPLFFCVFVVLMLFVILMSSHDSHDDERVASLFAAIAQEYEEGVAATKVALASLNRAPHEAALHTIQANLDRWLDLAHA